MGQLAHPRFAEVRDLIDCYVHDFGRFVESMEDACRSGAEEFEFIRRDAWKKSRATRGFDAFGRFLIAALAFLAEVLLSLAAGSIPGFLHGNRVAPLEFAPVAVKSRSRRARRLK